MQKYFDASLALKKGKVSTQKGDLNLHAFGEKNKASKA